MIIHERNLYPDLRGEDVRQLQDALLALGAAITDTEGFFGADTFEAVRNFQKDYHLPGSGIVDKATVRVINAALLANRSGSQNGYLVEGVLVETDGTPVTSTQVKLFEKGIRLETEIAQATTDSDGKFQIIYSRRSSDTMSILVRAFKSSGTELAASDRICDAGPIETVRLIVGGIELRGPSEYLKLYQLVSPILTREQLQTEDLTQEDIEFLACREGIDPVHLSYYVFAAQHNEDTGIDAQVFYGLFRMGLPNALDSLLALDKEDWRVALEGAISRNIVDQGLESKIGDFLDDLQNQVVQRVLRTPEPDAPTFSALFDLAGLGSSHRNQMVSSYVQRTGTVKDYWADMRADPSIPNTEIDALQFTLKESAIALNHLPLVTELKRLRSAGNIGPNLSDISSLKESDWLSTVQTQVQGKPIGGPEFFGKTDSERNEAYAGYLTRLTETLFPSEVLKARLKELPTATYDFSQALTFFSDNDDFDLKKQTVQEYVNENPTALSGVTDPDGALNTLKSIQRLFEVTTPFKKVVGIEAMMGDGLHSATAIYRMGATQFIRKYKTIVGLDEAQEIYVRASKKATATMMFLSQSIVFNPTNPAIIAPHLAGQGLPDLEDLFGSMDLCTCGHCNSVYSPASYLVDILHYLMNRPTVNGDRNAMEVLFDRRPDLGEIELNCQNSNTEMPYVDLVLEILETAIVHAGILPILPEIGDQDELFPFQTRQKSEFLKANPEHLNPSAYETVRDAVYPWSLPFDLWNAEMVAYLDSLRISYPDLVEHFQFESGPAEIARLAATRLGLTSKEHELVTAAGNESLQTLWGFTSQSEYNTFVSDANAAAVLRRTGLDFESMRSLLALPFIDPNSNLEIQFEDADCDLDRATVSNFNNAAAERIHRFVRLWRKTKWSIEELGAIMESLNANAITDSVLIQLDELQQLQNDLRVDLPVLLSWLGTNLADIAQNSETSLYNHSFLDSSVHKPELEAFQLNLTGDALAVVGGQLIDHYSTLRGVLRINGNDLTRLISAELTDGAMTLANLTRLYQASSLVHALRIPLQEFLSLQALFDSPVFGTANPDAIYQLAQLADRIRKSSFSATQLDELLRHAILPGPGIIPIQSDIQTSLISLRKDLYEIGLDYQVSGSGDELLKKVETQLAQLLPNNIFQEWMAILNTTSELSALDQESFVTTELTPYADPTNVVSELFGMDALTDPAERAGVLLASLQPYLTRMGREGSIVTWAMTTFDLDQTIAEPLLRTHIQLSVEDQPIMDALLDPGFALAPQEDEPDWPTITDELSFPLAFEAHHRLAKTSFVIQKLEITSEGLDPLTSNAGWLNPAAFPPAAVADPLAALNDLLGMESLFKWAMETLESQTALFELLAETASLDRTEFLELTANQIGWDIEDLDHLTGTSAMNLAYPNDFEDGFFLVEVAKKSVLIDHAEVSAATLQEWATTAPAKATADAVKQAARAQFADQSLWLTAAKPIRDKIREQQRAALVNYLLQTIRIQIPRFEDPQPNLSQGDKRLAVMELQLKLNLAGAHPELKVDGIFGPKTRKATQQFQDANGLPDTGQVNAAMWTELNQIDRPLKGPNELYAHFLVDVEMDPCMLTSRIVLAHSSVQLFVQRCMFNLEPEVLLSPEDTKEWEWMKQYRVWEANRKVFLYPENWLQPELRDDKTPIFESLESGLLQGELNEATMEREFLGYLRELNQVAKLEINAIYRQWEKKKDILHVFGRTPGVPHIYFYRKWVDQKFWTAWEKVDLDIEGDHLIPVVWNQRLYLFWPIFLEKAEQVENDGGEPEKLNYYEIRMAWTEYREGQWLSRQVSNSHIETAKVVNLPAREKFAFFPEIDEENNLYLLYELQTDNMWLALENSYAVPQQFRFSACHGTVEVTKLVGTGEVNGVMQGHWEPNQPTWHPWRRAFSHTRHHFNNLIEDTPGEKKLKVVTSGEIGTGFWPDYTWHKYLKEDTVTETTVLNKTPGHFQVTLPSTERIFNSRSPFFFFDEKRNFLVVPRGIYTGGFTDSEIGGFLNGAADSPIPMEMPDAVSEAVSGYIAQDAHPSQQVGAATEVAFGAIHQQSSRQGNGLGPLQWLAKGFRFEDHYHPFVCLLIEELNRYGIDGVLKPDAEKESIPARKDIVKSLHRQKRNKGYFQSTYSPHPNAVDDPHPRDDFNFDFGDAYSVYNWELFFHAPLLLAKRLSDNQQFSQAHRWFHYIFDPTYRPDDPLSEPWPDRVWKVKPFYQHGQGEHIAKTMLLLKSSGLSKAEKKERKILRDQIDAWRKDPFNPHLIARMRPEAYMKATVMAYLDNLLNWADFLFSQDSREAINEATQLYVLASDILGDRPVEINAHPDAVQTINGEEVRTFNDLKDHLDAFSNVLIELETMIEPEDEPGQSGGIGGLVAKSPNQGGGGFALDLPLAAGPVGPPDDNPPAEEPPLGNPVPAVLGPALFFCIPKNDQLLAYWDKVDDRLYKIRHCMNIDGVVRSLSLFQPAIDPGLLVKAAAAGLDLGTVLNDLNAPMPTYRFNRLVQTAGRMVQSTKQLGAMLLQAMERRDSEALELIRATHQTELLEGIRMLKVKQIDESNMTLESLHKAWDVADGKRRSYSLRSSRNDSEEEYVAQLGHARDDERSAQDMQLMAANISRFLPDFSVGWSGVGPHVSATIGRGNITAFHQFSAQKTNNQAAQHSYNANLASIYGIWGRRAEDWRFEERSAEREMAQIEKQIEAAKIRIELEEQDLRNYESQIANAQTIEEYYKNKYTGEALYNWMLSQITGIYFQSYQMAYDIARQAERAYRHELGIEDSSIIQFGYWDNLKKGLMAGEKLETDLQKLEIAYLEDNPREFELSRHVSLRQLNPAALIALKATGHCEVSVPEWLFDQDCPGHYHRRIKSVSVSIPAVVGPYTSVNCTLSLLRSSIRRSSLLLNDAYARDTENDDARFSDHFGAIQSIVTSTAQNDSGMFQLNFQDERFLPFEGAGAISTWGLDLPPDLRQFDYDTISDVIIHIRYTARQGGGLLQQSASNYLTGTLLSNANEHVLTRMFSLKQDFANDWHRFRQDTNVNFQTVISRDHFPYFAQAGNLELASTPFELWQIDPVAGTATLVPLGGGDVVFTLADLNGQDRQSTLELAGTLDPDGEYFFLVNYALPGA